MRNKQPNGCLVSLIVYTIMLLVAVLIIGYGAVK